MAASTAAPGRLEIRRWLLAHWAELAAWVLVIAYIAFFGTLTVRKHDAFQTTAFDLGNVDQAVWNTHRGRILHMTNIEGLTNRLGTHVEPILLPLSLLYFVWSDPRVLLLLQTLVIALGAWPVYLLAQHATRNTEYATRNTQATSVLALTFALTYLLFPALQSANAFDFHAVALAPTFFLLAFYCLETERWGGFALFALLTMSCKEDMPLLVAMLGLYALVVRRRWRVGLLTVAAAGAWFFLAVGWIMPHFDTRSVSPFANRYAHLGDGPLEIAVTIVTRPGLVLDQLRAAGALAYLRDLLSPVAFLSLLAPQVLTFAAPSLAVNLLSSDGQMHQLEGFHYGAPLAPIIVISAVYGAAWLLRRFHRVRVLPLVLSVAFLAASLLYHVGHGYTPLAADFSGTWPHVTEHDRLGQQLAEGIPTEASLAALPRPNPHASQRQWLTMIDRVAEGRPAPLQVAGREEADYVWLDATDSWPLHPNDLKRGVEDLLAGAYGVDQATDGWLLLRRGAADKTLPDAFYTFARAAAPQPQYPMQLQFLLDGQPILECLGFDLHRQPAHNLQPTTYRLTLYWRALQPLPPNLRLYPFYFDDASGEIIEDTTLRPLLATLWYPPQRWQPGEIVQTRTLPWDVGEAFSVGLGVVQGDDWRDVDARLPIRVESSALVVRLFDGDTYARLLHVEEGRPVEEYRQFAAPSPEHPVNADFDGQIRLLGYDLDHNLQPTAYNLTLYWQAQTRLDTSYAVFAQLLGPAGNVRAQADGAPQGGGYPTTWWLPGEIVADDVTLALPSDAPRDVAYRLIVGLYPSAPLGAGDSRTSERLVVAETGADFVELTTVEP